MINVEITICVDGEPYFLEIEPMRMHHSRYKQEFYFPEHVHPAYHLIFTDLYGCTLHLPNLQPIYCPEKSLLLLNPSIPHRFTFGAKETEHNSIIWAFRSRQGRELLKPLQSFDGSDEALARPYMLKVLTPVQAQNYLRMHREAEKAVYLKSEFVRSLKYFRLWTLGLELLLGPEWQSAMRNVGSTEYMVEKIYQLIDINFCYKTFNIAYLAKELGKNANYLNTLFAGREGIGLGEAIRNRRIEHAKTLLEGTNDRIKEIYDQCGFARQNYFTQAFKRSTGQTPLEYRRQIGKIS